MEPRTRSDGRRAVWLVLGLALAVRMYGVTSPLTDGGHERQTQTAMIARNFYRDGLNIFYPRMNMFAPQPGYVALEFPLQAELMAVTHRLIGPSDIVGRLITIAFSTASVALMYLVAGFFLPQRSAIAAAAIYALTPMSIYFGRAVYPEALLMFFSLGALYLLLRWSERPNALVYAASLVCAAMAALVKAPPGLAMLLPLAAVWWVRCGRALWTRPELYAYVGLAIAPIGAWIAWSAVMADPDPAAGFNVYQFATIRRAGIPFAWFSPFFYFWMLRALFLVTLTPVVLALAVLGLRRVRTHRLAPVVYAWIAAMIFFVFGTPGAQMTHWNYQVPLIPVGALLAGFGIEYVRAAYRQGEWPQRLFVRHPLLALGAAAILVAGHLAIYAYVARDAYDINKRVPYALEVAAIVQKEIPDEGFVILVQPGAIQTSQAYFMDRNVRALSVYADLGAVTVASLEGWRERGAVGVVVVDTPYGSGTASIRESPDVLAYLRRTFRTVTEGAHFMIYSRP